AYDDRRRANTNCHFPQMETSMRNEPERGGGPELCTSVGLGQSHGEGGRDEALDDANVPDEMLVKHTGIGYPRYEVVPALRIVKHVNGEPTRQKDVEPYHGVHADFHRSHIYLLLLK